MLCRRYNTQLCYTPMINSRSFAQFKQYREHNFTPCEGDRPLVAQFAGDDPETLLAAALHVQDHVDAVDLNLGCPQGIARRGHYGSFLLEETELLARIVTTLSRGLRVPVTCKIRLLEAGFDATLHLCRVLQAAGCSILTVHGRTRKEKKDLIREANWEAIRRIKAELAIPVFANGGIETFADVQRCLAQTGVDGVMSSEALLEFPALFANVPYSVRLLDELAAEHLALARVHTELGSMAVRLHLFKYLYSGLQRHTDLREALSHADGMDAFQAIVDEMARRRAAHEYDCTTPDSCGQVHSTRSWYTRYMRDLDGATGGESAHAEANGEEPRSPKAAALPSDDIDLAGCSWL